MLNIVCNSSSCLIVSPVRISHVPGLESLVPLLVLCVPQIVLLSVLFP